MRNFLILFLGLFLSITFVQANNLQNIQYKNISNGAKVSVSDDGFFWKDRFDKKSANNYVKKSIYDGYASSDYYFADGDFAFSTGCQYEFIAKNALIGYSNDDLKFYELSLNEDKVINKRELIKEEVEMLFPEFKVINMSEFSNLTNSLKIKKGKDCRIILLNDTDNVFGDYSFSTNNSKFKNYPLKGFIDVKKTGMISFSSYRHPSEQRPLYVLLVR